MLAGFIDWTNMKAIVYLSWSLSHKYTGMVGRCSSFCILDYSVVHNGEISPMMPTGVLSKCTVQMYLQTDTEVITYIIDYLHRKKGLRFDEISSVIAAPFWQTIYRMEPIKRMTHEYLRNVFAAQLITGPFSIIVGFDGGFMALNDRLKLRSMVVGEKGDKVYVASEEAAIRIIEPNLDSVWSPNGGEPVIALLNGGVSNGS